MVTGQEPAGVMEASNVTMRTAGLWRASGAATVALSLAVLAACGDDDDSSAPDTTAAVITTASATTTAPAPTTTSAPATTAATAAPTTEAPTTAAPTTPAPPVTTGVPVPDGVDPAVVAELQAAVDEYDAAFAAATVGPADPNHPALLDATTDGGLRQGIQEIINGYAGAGQGLRPGSDGAVLVQKVLAVEAFDGSQATLTTCYYNGSELYDVASGAVVDGTKVTGQNRLIFERGDDGRWRLALGGPIGDELTVEANPC
jgi:hypothetical protein